MTRVPLLAAALALAAAPAATAAPLDVLATVEAPTKVSAAAGHVAWSARTAGRYRLVVRLPDGTLSTPAAVPSRSVPFDVDLGTDARGRVVATYSLCTREPRGNRGTPLPVWTSGAGCRAHRLDVASGKVTRLAGLSSASSVVLPAISGNRLAFVGKPKSTRARRQAILYVRDLRTGRTTRKATVPRRDGSDPWGPVAVDLAGSRVLVNSHDLDDEFNSYDSGIRFGTVGGAVRELFGASQSESCFAQVFGGTVDGRAAIAVMGGNSRWVVVRQEPGGKLQTGESNIDEAPEDGAPAVSSAFDGTRMVVAERTGDSAVRIRAFAPGPFRGGGIPNDVPNCG